ncbi:MAG: transcriptional regulator [Alphaproteobacteria bacterium]|nr:transcriptional regulator [Alphaproteobacteria bacterium]
MIAVKPVLDDKSHTEALARIEQLIGAKGGTPEGDELEVLSILVQAYEDRMYPIECPDLRSAILFRLDQGKLTFADLEALVGAKTASSILEGDPKLSITQARKLHQQWGVPAETLLA